MPTPEELIEQSAGDALKHLKKIIASKGRLQGNFYYAGVTKGTKAGIVITLTARDPKGSKATSQGKTIRAAIPGAKFARGTVSVEGAKLLFVPHSGNATKDHMKLGFKKGFDDKALKAMLRKSIFAAPGEVADESSGEEGETLDEVVLTKEESEALEELIAEQGDLSERNTVLQESFLSAEAGREELSELLGALADELKLLEAANPPDEAAIQAKRYALAEAIYVGEDPFPEVGDTLPDDIQSVLQASLANLDEVLALFDAQLWGQVVAGYRDAATVAGNQVLQLRKALRADGDDELLPIADTGLNSITDNHRVPLETAILDFNQAPTDGPAAAMKVVSQKADAFLAHIGSSAQIKQVDNNPFGVEVAVVATLTVPLSRLSAFAKNGL